jgi:hypothetical protein
MTSAKYGGNYGALFNATYVPNKLEAMYIKDPSRYLGPFFIAGLVAYFLLATILMQVVHYFRIYKSDSRLQKSHVGFMFFMIICKSVQVFIALWKREAADWGNYLELTIIEEASKFASTTSSAVTTVVQLFFIHRCFRLSNQNYYFAVPAVAGVVLNFSSALWMTAIMPTNFANKSNEFGIASQVFPISSVITDAIITLTTLYTLLRVRRKAISPTTLSMISRLVRLTLETATPPLITACLNAALTGQLNGPFVFLFLTMTPYLQAFSMMYTINLRSEIRDASAYKTGTDVENSMTLKDRVSRGTRGDPIKLQNVSVNVSHTVDTETRFGNGATMQGTQSYEEKDRLSDD